MCRCVQRAVPAQIWYKQSGLLRKRGDAMSIEPPRRLGKYELRERLGHGGMAEVWKALDTQLQRYVAIKLLHTNLKEDPHFNARFEHEARLIASLHHPNIVQIHDFQLASSDEEGTIAYMVM